MDNVIYNDIKGLLVLLIDQIDSKHNETISAINRDGIHSDMDKSNIDNITATPSSRKRVLSSSLSLSLLSSGVPQRKVIGNDIDSNSLLALNSQYNTTNNDDQISSSLIPSHTVSFTPNVSKSPPSTPSIEISTPLTRTSLFLKPNLKPSNSVPANRRYKENEYIIPSRIINDANPDSLDNNYIIEIQNLKMLNNELNEVVELQRKEIDAVLVSEQKHKDQVLALEIVIRENESTTKKNNTEIEQWKSVNEELQSIAEEFLLKINTLEAEKQQLSDYIGKNVVHGDNIANTTVNELQISVKTQADRISELETINKQLRLDATELESNVNELIKSKKDMEKIVFDQLDLINDLSGKVEETTALQKTLNEKKSKINDLYKDLNEAKEQVFYQKVTIDSNAKFIAGLEEEIKNLKLIINENKKSFFIQLENLNADIAQKKKVIDEKNYEIANLIDDITNSNGKISRLENDIVNSNKNNNNDKIMRDNMEHTFFLEKESLNSKISLLDNQIQILENQTQNLENTITRLNDTIKDNNNTISSLKSEYQSEHGLRLGLETKFNKKITELEDEITKTKLDATVTTKSLEESNYHYRNDNEKKKSDIIILTDSITQLELAKSQLMQQVTNMISSTNEIERNLHLATTREKELNERLKQSEVDLNEAKLSLSSLLTELNTAKITNNKLNETITSGDDIINNLRAKILTLTNDNNDNVNIIASYRETERALRTELKDLEILKNDFEVKLTMMTSNFEKEEEQSSLKDNEIMMLKKTVDQLTMSSSSSSSSILSLENEKNHLKASLDSKSVELSAKDNELLLLKKTVNQLNQSVEQWTISSSSLSSSILSLENEKNQLSASVESKSMELSLKESEILIHKKTIDQLNTSVEQLTLSSSSLSSAILSLENEKNQLISSVESKSLELRLKNELTKSIQCSNKILINKAIMNIGKTISYIDNSDLKNVSYDDINNINDDDDDSDNLHNLHNYTMTLLTETASLKEMITSLNKLVQDTNKSMPDDNDDDNDGDTKNELNTNLISGSKGIISNMINMMKDISYRYNLKVNKMSVRINDLVNNDHNNNTIIRDLNERLQMNIDSHHKQIKMKNIEIDANKKEIELLKNDIALALNEAEKSKNDCNRTINDLKKMIKDSNDNLETSSKQIESLKAALNQEKNRFSTKDQELQKLVVSVEKTNITTKKQIEDLLSELNGIKVDNTALSNKIEYMNLKLEEKQRDIDSMLVKIQNASLKTDEERKLRAEYEKTLRKISLGNMFTNTSHISASRTNINTNTNTNTNTNNISYVNTNNNNVVDIQTDTSAINIDTSIVKNSMESFYLNISSDNYNDDDDTNDNNIHDSTEKHHHHILEKIEKSKKLLAKKSNKSYYNNNTTSASDIKYNIHNNKEDWALKGVKRIEMLLAKKGWKMTTNQ